MRQKKVQNGHSQPSVASLSLLSHRGCLTGSEQDKLTCVDSLAHVSVIESVKELVQYDGEDGNRQPANGVPR